MMVQVVTSPRDPSSAAEVSQTVGLSKVTVNYSRPHVISPTGVNRTGKIYGTNVAHFGYAKPFPGFGSGHPFLWRAGANENTTITLSDDAIIAGKPIAAGTYGLFMALTRIIHDIFKNYDVKPEICNRTFPAARLTSQVGQGQARYSDPK